MPLKFTRQSYFPTRPYSTVQVQQNKKIMLTVLQLKIIRTETIQRYAMQALNIFMTVKCHPKNYIIMEQTIFKRDKRHDKHKILDFFSWIIKHKIFIISFHLFYLKKI